MSKILILLGFQIATVPALNATDLYKKSVSKIVEIRSGGNTVCAGVWFKDQYVLTAAHCVRTHKDLYPIIYDSKIIPMKRYSFDTRKDLAILKTTVEVRHDIMPLTNSIVVGEDAYTIGHPLGYKYMFTKGQISLINTPKCAFLGRKCVILTTPINPGNSGGPCFNKKGEVFGIVSWKIRGVSNIGACVHPASIQDFINKAFSFWR